jgi:integrase
MSKSLHRLTPAEINAAPSGTALADGGGVIYRSGGKARGKFSFKFTSPDAEYRAAQAAKGSKTIQRELGLGAYPETTLAQARAKAAAARDLLARGIDPLEDAARAAEAIRQRGAELAAEATETVLTFGRYATETFLPSVLPEFSNPAHIQQWRSTFAVHAQGLHDKPLAEITRADVLAVLQPIWREKIVTASRSRQRIERLFSHAIQNGRYRGDNPASWSQFDATLPAPKLAPRHHPAVPYDQIADFVAAIRAKQSVSAAAVLLEWITLSACRSGEARFAVWSEIDTDRMLWSIPSARMKMRRDHVVPITTRMAEILVEARRRHPASATEEGPKPTDYIFANEAGRPLSEMAALMLMRRLPAFANFVPHGLRSAFRDWAGEKTEYARELIEEALAHQLGAVERAYRRGAAHERRRPLMEAWAAACDGTAPAEGVGNVVQLRAAGGNGGQA